MWTVEGVRSKLRDQVSHLGSQVAWAKKYGISPAYVNDVLKRNRAPGELILKAMKLKKVTVYMAEKAG